MEHTAHYTSTFLARQPIFDSMFNTWGYMVLFRACQDDVCAEITDPNQATAEVLATLPMVARNIPRHAKAMIRFPGQSIRDELPGVLQPERTAMITARMGCAGPDDLDMIRCLKEQGYLVAVDDLAPGCELDELVRLADILVLDFESQDETELRQLSRLAVSSGLTLMGKKVESLQAAELAKELGVTLFHGYFYQKPVVRMGKRLPATHTARMRLFEVLNQEEPDFKAIARAVEPDPGISFRLLNFLNSPYFGFSQPIQSVHHAVVLAGWTKVRNWLRLILLTDMAPKDKTGELVYLSTHRARFLEQLALASGHGEDASRLFLIGLFSLLDALLDMPMHQVVSLVCLEPDVEAALCGQDSPFGPWLALARTIEHGDWDAMGHLALNLRLPTGSVSRAYAEAYAWTDQFFSLTKD
ncbi:MAG: EAL and HDOD domain-containing protein [Desulfovibrio sp.]